MGPYNFQLPQHSDSHDGSYSPPLLTDRGLPPTSQVVRPFASSSTMAAGRAAKEPPSSTTSGTNMMLPPISAMYHHHHHQALPPVNSYHSGQHMYVAPGHHYHQHSASDAYNMSTSPSTASFGKHSPAPAPVPPVVARKRSRHAWPADMTRQIINVLLDEFLTDPSFRTTIYRSREERDHRFEASGRSILEEYNKVQNIRRRYFIPLSYLLQWDQMKRGSSGARNRLRSNIEKKLAKPLERSRLQMIFMGALKTATPPLHLSKSSATLINNDDTEDAESEAEETVVGNGGDAAKPMFELDIFVTELKRRDPRLWAQGNEAFCAWVSRKCSVDYILNH
ncbi:hypothetical protein GGI20_002198 [Coemansia sp. BCRC 34301]|nr:hypothetical protein GGI20_002198 [Coemansia sp. BCRC 34301]